MKVNLKSFLILLLFICSPPLLSQTVDYALSFDGENDYVLIHHHRSFNLTESFTITAWIYIREYEEWASIITKGGELGNPRTDGNNYTIHQSGPDGGSDFGYLRFTGSSPDLPQYLESGTKITLNEWHFVAITYDSDTLRFYLNGEPDGKGHLPGPLLIPPEEDPLYIGVDPPGEDEFWNGMIGEVQIWNISLSINQIRSLMCGVDINKDELIGYWALDEGGGNIAFDSSPNENHGNLIGNPQWVKLTPKPCEDDDTTIVAVAKASKDVANSGEFITFDGTESYHTNPDKDIVSYLWDFEDGSNAEGEIVMHRFRGEQNETKTYNVTLTVEDDEGDTDSNKVYVTVVPLERVVKVSDSPANAEMKIKYNWIDKINGDDIYIVSKIHTQADGLTGVFVPIILVWEYLYPIGNFPVFEFKDYLFAYGKPTEKTYEHPFSTTPVLGDDPRIVERTFEEGTFKGIQVKDTDTFCIYMQGFKLKIGLPPIAPVLFKWSAEPFHPLAQPHEPSLIEDLLYELLDLFVGKLGSPGELRVYDSEGRVTGLVNGEIVEEIPHSEYFDNKVLILSDGASYQNAVVGKEEGLYRLYISSIMQEESHNFNATDIPTAVNVIHRYTVDWEKLAKGEQGVTIEIDSTGDGTFDETITTTQPYTPSDPWPGDQATNVALEPELKWHGCDPDTTKELTYSIYLGTDDELSLIDTIGPFSAAQDTITYKLEQLEPYTTYYWRIVVRDNYGITVQSPVWSFTTGEVVSVEEDETIPIGYNLYQNYPNPFNPITIIDYDLPKDNYVSLFVYNTLGNRVATLVDEYQLSGRYRVTFDSKDIPSGVYFYRIQAGEFVDTKKMLLLR